MIREILDDRLVKITILIMSIIVSILISINYALISIIKFKTTFAIIGMSNLFASVFFMGMAGIGLYIIYRDFIKK